MYIETTIREFEWKCDHCQRVEKVKGVKNKRPQGWTVQSVGPCGMTDYFRDEDWCDLCTAMET